MQRDIEKFENITFRCHFSQDGCLINVMKIVDLIRKIKKYVVLNLLRKVRAKMMGNTAKSVFRSLFAVEK